MSEVNDVGYYWVINNLYVLLVTIELLTENCPQFSFKDHAQSQAEGELSGD